VTEQPRPLDPAVTYSSYLALDEILAAQRPRSDEHDEMLFIVIHQVYELWFKQLLHELAHAQELLVGGWTPRILHTLKRALTILKVVVSQVDVLETMTPSQFSQFRNRLDAASGFQSGQFRELEAVIGIRAGHGQSGPAGERLSAARSRPSLWDSFARYLVTQGYQVPASTLSRNTSAPIASDEAMRDVLLAVYADDGGAAQVSERLVDLDEGLQEWRYRHLKMVERTIGDKAGTGGSSGAAYLRSTLSQPVFVDLWAVRTQL
jgi:tryptophan 2,3-dioxygenase